MNKQVRLLTLSALMCALIIVSTLWLKFTIPGTDVMVTSQVFFVLLCGLLLPPRYCFYTLGTYLLLGLAGLPVFSAACWRFFPAGDGLCVPVADCLRRC